jgi:ribosomal protein S18 acetylase RimI-like enzyme
VRAFWEASGSSQGGEPPATPRPFARGLAATALGGWDGRRGWLYHVAVRSDQRRHGLGGRLVRIIEQRLGERGCPKVNLIEKEL